MMKLVQNFNPIVLLVIATIFEAGGDAVVRMAIYDNAGVYRVGLFLGGGLLLLAYGSLVNLAPFQFGQVAGLYLATLFVTWQIINFLFFRAMPTLPILVGGAFILVGGAIVTFWKTPL